jgi:hypothetical protein
LSHCSDIHSDGKIINPDAKKTRPADQRTNMTDGWKAAGGDRFRVLLKQGIGEQEVWKYHQQFDGSAPVAPRRPD